MGELSQRLLDWYHRHKRTLPWRDHPDAYAVWVSEIMLQQTRVETVLAYFQRWMERFPTLQTLAEATEEQVLQVWEGLGYYSRARNLHRAARVVVDEFGGRLPSDRRLLEQLPGVGRYTAGAIASMAFGQDEPALDGNIRRVLARLFDLTLPARSPEGERRLWELAAEHLPAGRAGDYNQALMDLGATVCTPRRPNCPLCPLAGLCQARSLGVQEQRPVTLPRAALPHYLVAAAILSRGPQAGDCGEVQILIARRPSRGLLGGLWEFPGGKLQEGEEFCDALRREIREELGVSVKVGEEFGIYRHAYTHFRVTLHAFCCTLVKGEPYPLNASALAWVLPSDLAAYPMGKIDRQIARKLAATGSDGRHANRGAEDGID
ncbi:MAG: A/G-specific adenine glycosylase [Chloroflexi bacterium]|nr:A/G-specific adenine glycosylase [Chloroflexota bacterium]